MTTLVALDRDGTITEDNDYYLGSQTNWRDLVEFRPGVVTGLQELQREGIELVVVTNQAGVALKGREEGHDFDMLDTNRLNEVNSFIESELANEGITLAATMSCCYVLPEYVETSAQRGRTVDARYVASADTVHLVKPSPGMLHAYASMRGTVLSSYNQIITIGDRYSDVQLGANAGGTGILVPSNKTRNKDKIKLMPKGIIKSTFLEAAQHILNQ